MVSSRELSPYVVKLLENWGFDGRLPADLRELSPLWPEYRKKLQARKVALADSLPTLRGLESRLQAPAPVWRLVLKVPRSVTLASSVAYASLPPSYSSPVAPVSPASLDDAWFVPDDVSVHPSVAFVVHLQDTPEARTYFSQRLRPGAYVETLNGLRGWYVVRPSAISEVGVRELRHYSQEILRIPPDARAHLHYEKTPCSEVPVVQIRKHGLLPGTSGSVISELRL